LSIIKAKSFLHEYKIRAKDKDINSLSGRQGRADLTYFINMNIFNSLNIKENETILDIGCGDLTFFKIIEKNFNNCTLEGVLPTSEEIEKVNKEIKFKEYKNKTQISKAFSFKLPFCDNKFDKVVINGVLLLLNKEEVDNTLNEISRVSKNNATIYIGELPFVDEFKDKSYGNSIIKWLFYGLKNRGFRYFFNSLKTVFISLFSKNQMILGVKEHYFINKEDFIKKAKKYDLVLKECFFNKQIDVNKNIINSSTRYDYIFKIEKKRLI